MVEQQDSVCFHYRGYEGSCLKDTHEGQVFFYGTVLNISDLVTYEAQSKKHLEREFRAAVDDHLIDINSVVENRGLDADSAF